MFRAFLLALTITITGGVAYLRVSAAAPSTSSVPQNTPTLTPASTLTPSLSPTSTSVPTTTSTLAPTPTSIVTPTLPPISTPTKSPTSTLKPTSTPSRTPTPIITSTPSPSPRPTPNITSTPIPTSTPTPTPTPSITAITFTSAQVYEFTNQYGAEYKVDPNVLRYIAICETGFNPLSKNSLYAGLYQYSVTTWSSYRNQMHLDPNPDLRLNAQEAVRTTAYVLSLGQVQNWPNCYPK